MFCGARNSNIQYNEVKTLHYYIFSLYPSTTNGGASCVSKRILTSYKYEIIEKPEGCSPYTYLIKRRWFECVCVHKSNVHQI